MKTIEEVAGGVLACVAALANLPNISDLDKDRVLNTFAALTALDIPKDAVESGKKVIDDIFKSRR